MNKKLIYLLCFSTFIWVMLPDTALAEKELTPILSCQSLARVELMVLGESRLNKEVLTKKLRGKTEEYFPKKYSAHRGLDDQQDIKVEDLKKYCSINVTIQVKRKGRNSFIYYTHLTNAALNGGGNFDEGVLASVPTDQLEESVTSSMFALLKKLKETTEFDEVDQ